MAGAFNFIIRNGNAHWNLYYKRFASKGSAIVVWSLLFMATQIFPFHFNS